MTLWGKIFQRNCNWHEDKKPLQHSSPAPGLYAVAAACGVVQRTGREPRNATA